MYMYIYIYICYTDAGDSQAFYGYDAKQNTVLLSFRGSSNVPNWIENIDAVKTDYPYCTDTGCKVHVGFYKAYLQIVSQVILK